MGDYLANPASKPYRDTIQRIERYRALPTGLLGNLLQRESQFNPMAQSPAGARGIAQLMPVHHDAVNPDDPVASMQYASKYLTQLHARFGDWREALAAYNWGQGNVARAKSKYGDDWLNFAPEETRKYVEALAPGKTEPYRGPPRPAPEANDIDALLSKYGKKESK